MNTIKKLIIKILAVVIGMIAAVYLYGMYFGRAHTPFAISIIIPIGVVVIGVLLFIDHKSKANKKIKKKAVGTSNSTNHRNGFYISFKHCGVFGKDWIVTDNTIVINETKIKFSDIDKIFDISIGNQPVFQFRAMGKRYVVDCWGRQAKEFECATKHISLRSSDPVYSIYVPDYEKLNPTRKAEMSVKLRAAKIEGCITTAEYEKLINKLDATETPYDYSAIQANLQFINERNAKYAQKQGTKTIIKDAVIGGVVAGPAGAVVGAVVGKNKVDSKKQ